MFLPLLAGSLHVGDEIVEINGQSVSNHSVDQLQKMLVGICVWRGCSPRKDPFGLQMCMLAEHSPPPRYQSHHTAACSSVMQWEPGSRAGVL